VARHRKQAAQVGEKLAAGEGVQTRMEQKRVSDWPDPPTAAAAAAAPAHHTCWNGARAGAVLKQDAPRHHPCTRRPDNAEASALRGCVGNPCLQPCLLPPLGGRSMETMERCFTCRSMGREQRKQQNGERRGAHRERAHSDEKGRMERWVRIWSAGWGKMAKRTSVRGETGIGRQKPVT
jgi:hypothetical protein